MKVERNVPRDLEERLRRGERITGFVPSGGVGFDINPAAPYVATAIHAGHGLREELLPFVTLSDADRYYEEDPATDDFIADAPSRIWALDSRFEYDLNRAPDRALPLKKEWVWGLEVYGELPPEGMLLTCMKKFNEFYELVDMVARSLLHLHGACLLFDVHSYNISRQVTADRPVPPTFNLGTKRLDRGHWGPEIDAWLGLLNGISLPGVDVRALENEVFGGMGQLCRAAVAIDQPNVLVLPTEVSKVYMDEDAGKSHPDIIMSLRAQMGAAMAQLADGFARDRCSGTPQKKRRLVPDSALVVDHALAEAGRWVDLLKYVNPTNRTEELERYLSEPGSYEPEMHYLPLEFDPQRFVQSLQAIPVDRIEDRGLGDLYESLRREIMAWVELLTLRGKPEFLEAALKLYPAPSSEDVGWCEGCLRREAHIQPEDQDSETFKRAAESFLFKLSQAYPELAKYEVVMNPQLSSDAAFRKGRVEIRPNAYHTAIHVENQNRHEIYSHVLTHANGKMQPLEIFRSGFPGATLTQEGLGVFGEYMDHVLPHERIRTLSARIVACDRLVRGQTFCRTAEELSDEFGFSPHNAFTISFRVYRSGGFPKDAVYLQGLVALLRYWLDGGDISLLYIGKVSLASLPLIKDLIERQVLIPSKFVPLFLHDHKFMEATRQRLASASNLLERVWADAPL